MGHGIPATLPNPGSNVLGCLGSATILSNDFRSRQIFRCMLDLVVVMSDTNHDDPLLRQVVVLKKPFVSHSSNTKQLHIQSRGKHTQITRPGFRRLLQGFT